MIRAEEQRSDQQKELETKKQMLLKVEKSGVDTDARWIKRWFNSNHARYKGITKMHTQNLMEAIAYNLYRSPGRVA
jgi:IS5 family transposase